MLFPFPLCNNACLFYTLCTASSRLSSGLHYFVVCLSLPVFSILFSLFASHGLSWRLSNIIISSIFLLSCPLLTKLNYKEEMESKGFLSFVAAYIFFPQKIQNTQRPWSHHHTLLILHHISHHTTNQTDMIPFYLSALHIPYGYIIRPAKRAREKGEIGSLVLLCVVFAGI